MGIRFDFYKKRKVFFGISIVILAAGLLANIIFGTNVDIQFVGGAMVKYSVTGGDVNASAVQDIVRDSLDREANVTISRGMLDDEQQVTISFSGNQAISTQEQETLAETLTKDYDKLSFELVESSSVDPVMGASFLQKCLICVLITVILLLIYIGFRFKKIGGLSAGVTAIIALLHDVLIIYFVFVFFRLPINDIFMAVLLTILGYSLNDTIVIYDRIRENRKKFGAKMSYADIINISLNQTLGRTIMTSVTTFIALLVIVIVSIMYNMTTVTAFALPMMFGIISGCYSSLFIAAPLYGMWKTRARGKKK